MRLRISVTFCAPGYGGTRDEGRAVDWPPAPWRLYCALLAGSRSAARGADQRWAETCAPAFQWLECQPPPVIVAPRVAPGRVFRNYVPLNDADVALKSIARGRQPLEQNLPSRCKVPRRHAPMHLIDGNTIHYIWQVTAEDKPIAEQMAKEAVHLLVLGRGVDQAHAHGIVEDGDDVPSLDGVRWWPGIGRVGSVRIPQPGALDDLEEIYTRTRQRIRDGGLDLNERPRSFRSIVYWPDYMPVPRPYAAFYLRAEEGDPAEFFRWESSRASELAAAVRRLVKEAAIEDGLPEQWIREYATGHVVRGVIERLSYLCLPTTGEPYADGLIRRIVVAEPWGGTGVHANWVRRRLAGKRIRDAIGEFGGRLEPIIEGDSDVFDGVLGLYKAAARTWTTVTPAVMPGYGSSHPRFKRMVERMFAQAGLPYPARWRTLPGCTWRGKLAEPYDLPVHHRGLPLQHFEIEFSTPLPGPIAIGSGRHAGLGILAGKDAAPLLI